MSGFIEQVHDYASLEIARKIPSTADVVKLVHTCRELVHTVAEREKAFQRDVKRMENATAGMHSATKQLDALPAKMLDVLRNDRKESSAQMARMERLMDSKWSSLADKSGARLSGAVQEMINTKWTEITEALGVVVPNSDEERSMRQTIEVTSKLRVWMENIRPVLEKFVAIADEVVPEEKARSNSLSRHLQLAAGALESKDASAEGDVAGTSATQQGDDDLRSGPANPI